MESYLKVKHRSYVLFAALYAAICLAGIGVVLSSTSRLLESYALMEAKDWAADLEANLVDLPRIAEGDDPNASVMLVLDRARRLGRVFEFSIYNAEGQLQLKSTELASRGATVSPKLQNHLPEFAKAIAKQEPAVMTRPGRTLGEPDYYSVAITPIMDGKRHSGWLETVIDQTERRSLFLSSAAMMALVVGLLLALGPLFGFWYRSRQKKRAELQLAYFSRHDTMTGLLNRAAWMTAVEEFMAKAKPEGAGSALMHIHLGGVSTANSIHGNLAGDHILRVSAQRIRESVPPDALLARISGDKFGILLREVDAIGAARAAKAVTAAVAEPIEWQEQSITTVVSIGIALFPHDGDTQSSLSKCADLALALSRQAGLSCYRFFDSSIEVKAQKQRDLERIVGEALDNNYLELHFQPVYELRSGKLSGFEALVRLKHPERGYISPSEFIPVAERTGDIDRIGAWCLEEACTIASNWPPEITISVNLSPVQFDSGSLIATLRRVFEKTRFPAYQLELEITEGLLLGDSEVIRTQLAAMSDMGVRIVLDDFGTGYSSFNYLWKFPFAKMKIDQSFVRAMEENASVLGIVRTIILLGRSLGLPVTAEGIETPSQAVLLRKLRCDLGQGYLFSRPVPVTEVARLILVQYAEALRAQVPASAETSSPAAGERLAG